MVYRFKNIDIVLDVYFLSRIGSLMGMGMQESIQYLLGTYDAEAQSVTGGLLDNIEARAAVLAAGSDALSFSNGTPKFSTLFDGFEMLRGIDITDPQWSELYQEVVKSILPKDGKKKEAAKKARSLNGAT